MPNTEMSTRTVQPAAFTPQVLPLLIALVESLTAVERAPAASGAIGTAALRPCLAAYVQGARRSGLGPEEMLRRLRHAVRQAAAERPARIDYDQAAACLMPWALAEYFRAD